MLYIISGCNGAGKTTASYAILPDVLNCKEFVNADEIAKGLSPFQPDKVGIEAGRIMLNRINELIDKNATFAFETTLTTKSYTNTIRKAKAHGYKVVLLFFWLQNVNIAIERVKQRVQEGGHNIPLEVIKRRYTKGIDNLFKLFISIVDLVYIFDNSEGNHELIAEKIMGKEISIINESKYNKLRLIYEKR